MADLKRFRFSYEGKQYSVYGHTQTELLAKAAAKKRALEKGQARFRNISVVAWRDEWLDVYKRGKVAPGTFTSYKAVLSHLEIAKPVKDVTPADLQRALNALEGKSDSLIHKFMVLTKELFSDAVDNGLCSVSPARKLARPRGVTRSRRPLTLPERRLIEEVAPLSPAGPYVALMLYAGCRPSEAGSIQGKDVDATGRVLHIRGTKTESADRFVPITDRLFPYIEHLAPEEYAVIDALGNPSGRYGRRGIWRRFVAELRAAGLDVAPDLQPYLLRHTFCTDLEAAGVPINVARDLMGHSSITITSKIYTHRSTDAFSAAAEKMAAYNNAKK